MVEVAADAVREQIEKLIQSKTFQTSEVHRRLLQYLADRTLAGDADRLKEYTVGLEAFAKPPTYDPKHDSIVRLQMGRLRQKLAVYYQGEANGDPVLVTLPKGAFKLVFEPHGTPPPSGEIESARAQRRAWMLAAGLIAAAIWAVAATVMAVHGYRQAAPLTESWSSDLEILWKPYLESKRPLLVSLGTPLFV